MLFHSNPITVEFVYAAILHAYLLLAWTSLVSLRAKKKKKNNNNNNNNKNNNNSNKI